jgi:primosomal protein N' (replication factor Y)
VLRLLYRHPDAAQAEQAAGLVAAQLRLAIQERGQQSAADVAGPAPAFFGKIANEYRWQILLRGPDPTDLVRSLSLPKGWVVDVDPLSTL